VIRPDGKAVLVDFGLVKLWDPSDPRRTTAMRGMGTPEYAPLEQYDAAAGHTDQRSDLYGLGATLYHALTGRVPPTITSRILDPAALPRPRTVVPDVQPGTEEAIVKAMEVHPGNRFATATDMRAALALGRRRGRRLVADTPAPIAVHPAEVPMRHPPAPADAAVQEVAQRSAGRSHSEPPANAAHEGAHPSPSKAGRLATASFVMGLLSLALLCLAASAPSIILAAMGLQLVLGVACLATGIAALRRIGGVRPRPAGWRMAVIGTALGVLAMLMPCVVGIVAIADL